MAAKKTESRIMGPFPFYFAKIQIRIQHKEIIKLVAEILPTFPFIGYLCRPMTNNSILDIVL